MFKKNIFLLCSTILLIHIHPSFANHIPSTNSQVNQIQNPVDLLQNSIVSTQKILIDSKNTLSQDPEALIKLIDNKIIPLLAIDVIAQLLIGRERWQSASKEEQQQFITKITQMLAYSYAENIAQAENYDIQILPFSNDSWQGQRLIIVTGKIINLQNHASSDLLIKLLKVSNKSNKEEDIPQWKIYDLSVAGVSILDNFRAQFKDHKNLKDINLAIEKKNNELIDKKS
ncbi:MlaC/ttg2D family ABC transporter substrate-binding protein [Fastidiosibacter lacustris]|uniref:MlaC/ttg2D family ABC transporter substrate-binding protein n=1 Tax=Fastidiosibacter lacustris TaxID=2056695 RepID=UPI000E345CCC|nr:ABC transporter substrate-binding protein [Fastidiosibacter lacustris]